MGVFPMDEDVVSLIHGKVSRAGERMRGSLDASVPKDTKNILIFKIL